MDKPLQHGSELLELSNMVNLCLCVCIATRISCSGALARWRAAGEDQKEAALQRDGGQSYHAQTGVCRQPHA